MLLSRLPATMTMLAALLVAGCAGMTIDGPGGGPLPGTDDSSNFTVPQTGESFHTTDSPFAPSNGFWGND